MTDAIVWLFDLEDQLKSNQNWLANPVNAVAIKLLDVLNTWDHSMAINDDSSLASFTFVT